MWTYIKKNYRQLLGAVLLGWVLGLLLARGGGEATAGAGAESGSDSQVEFEGGLELIPVPVPTPRPNCLHCPTCNSCCPGMRAWVGGSATGSAAASASATAKAMAGGSNLSLFITGSVPVYPAVEWTDVEGAALATYGPALAGLRWRPRNNNELRLEVGVDTLPVIRKLLK